MEYRTGSYVIVGQKQKTCEHCKSGIAPGQKQFIRVRESKDLSYTSNGESFYRKTYQRWHLKCAILIQNLNEYEKQLLGPTVLSLHAAQDARGDTIMPQKVSEAV